jgi:hypothetical protein
LVLFRKGPQLSWNCLVAVLKDHGQSALAKIPEFVGKIVVDFKNHILVGKVSVVPKAYFCHHKETRLIHTKLNDCKAKAKKELS